MLLSGVHCFWDGIVSVDTTNFDTIVNNNGHFLVKFDRKNPHGKLMDEWRHFASQCGELGPERCPVLPIEINCHHEWWWNDQTFFNMDLCNLFNVSFPRQYQAFRPHVFLMVPGWRDEQEILEKHSKQPHFSQFDYVDDFEDSKIDPHPDFPKRFLRPQLASKLVKFVGEPGESDLAAAGLFRFLQQQYEDIWFGLPGALKEMEEMVDQFCRPVESSELSRNVELRRAEALEKANQILHATAIERKDDAKYYLSLFRKFFDLCGVDNATRTVQDAPCITFRDKELERLQGLLARARSTMSVDKEKEISHHLNILSYFRFQKRLRKVKRKKLDVEEIKVLHVDEL